MAVCLRRGRAIRSLMKRRLTATALAAFVVALHASEARSGPLRGGAASGEPASRAAAVSREEGPIVGLVAADGRIVLTNMGAYTPPPASVASRSLPVSRFQSLISDISRRHGVDPRLTQAVIEVESAFDPNAVSPRGAVGLMQLIPSTGRRFGVNNLFDPADNIAGGVRFLRFLIEKFDGNADLVLAAYNSGENRVERLGRIPAIPETQTYVRRVRAAYERLGGQPVFAVAHPAGIAGETRAPAAIERSVDERGVPSFSNVGPTR